MTYPAKLAGRCSNGFERDRGHVVHMVPDETRGSGWGVAVCGKKPGPRSAGWADMIGHEVTCPKCRLKLPHD